MSLSTGFLSAITKKALNAIYVLQIEGLPDAYSDGTWTGDPEDDANLFFGSTSDPAIRLTPLRILPWLKLSEELAIDALELSGTEIDHREGRADRGTMRISISDRDGSLRGLWATRRNDKAAFLMDELSRLDPSMTIDRDMSAVWPSSSILFVGSETIGAAGATGDTFPIQRGLFGSRKRNHRGTEGNAVGEQVTPYPKALKGRKATLWLSYNQPQNSVRLFSGPIKSTGWDDFGQTLVIQAEDGQSALKKKIFTGLGERLSGLPNWPAPIIKFATDTYKPPDGSPWLDRDIVTIGPVDPDKITVGETFLAATPSLLLRLTRANSGVNAETMPGGDSRTFPFITCFADVAHTGVGLVSYPPSSLPQGSFRDQGQIDSAWIKLQEGQELKEFATVPNDDFVDGFTGTDGASVGNSALIVLLQILVSTGAGYEGMGGATCQYDTLPEDQGLGIPPEEIDIAAFERESVRDPVLTGEHASSNSPRILVLETITDCREWAIKNILKPLGAYLLIGADGRITIKRVRDLEPDEKLNLPAIGMDDLVRVGDGPRLGEIEKFEGPIRDGEQRTVSIEWNSGPVYEGGKVSLVSKQTLNISDADQSDDATDEDTLVVESQGIGDLGALQRGLISRFAQSPEKITGTLQLEQFPRGVGDMVVIDFPDLPSGENPDVGLTNTIAEVSRREFDPARHVIELELSVSNLGLSETRYIAPSARVVSGGGTGGSTTTLTVSEHDFTAGAQTDCQFFVPGVKVRIFSADLSQSSNVVDCISGSGVSNQVVVNGTFGRTVGPGDIIELAAYPDSRVDERTQYVFGASGLEQLNSSEDPAVWAR